MPSKRASQRIGNDSRQWLATKCEVAKQPVGSAPYEGYVEEQKMIHSYGTNGALIINLFQKTSLKQMGLYCEPGTFKNI